MNGVSQMVADPKQHGLFIANRPGLADKHGGDLTTGGGMGFPK